MHTASLLKNGKVLVVGGYPGTTLTYLNPEIYDPDTNTWADAGTILYGGYFQTNFYNHTATLLQSGQVLVVGGQIYPGSAFPMDPCCIRRTNSWSNVTNAFTHIG